MLHFYFHPTCSTLGTALLIVSVIILHHMGFQIVMAKSIKLTVFWDVALCSITETCWHFRADNCLQHQSDDQHFDNGGSKHLWNVIYFLQKTAPFSILHHSTITELKYRWYGLNRVYELALPKVTVWVFVGLYTPYSYASFMYSTLFKKGTCLGTDFVLPSHYKYALGMCVLILGL
jgi:hypothetical protein